MITDLFGSLLEELQEHLKMKDLHPDANGSCLIKFPTGISIQIEPDKQGKFLIIGTKFETIPESRYRENIFREALRANGMPYPHYGTFAFSKKSDCLILFDTIYMDGLNGLTLFDRLKPFAEKAFIWKEAITRGEIPSLIQNYSTDHPVGLFGPKP